MGEADILVILLLTGFIISWGLSYYMLNRIKKRKLFLFALLTFLVLIGLLAVGFRNADPSASIVVGYSYILFVVGYSAILFITTLFLFLNNKKEKNELH